MKARQGFRGALRLAPTVALGLGSLFGSSSLVRGAEVADLVQSYGLLPVEPPRPAADFELPRSGGGVQSLSDYAGQWTVLTFWASWCGPCRAEMPSLERLHQSHSDRGVVILGVSVDRSRTAADAFIEEHGLTFPQVWDQQGTVGAAYQATAIPMSYLIDPRGRIVALSRGSRDWTEMAGLLDGLLQQVPADSASDNVYVETVELPGVADPPSAKVEVSNSNPQVGQEFFVDVRLRWAGNLEEYLPSPPKVFLPDGVVEKGVTASTDSRDGSQVVVYRIALQVDQPGSFALDPIELRYRPRLADDVATSRVLGPTVVVEPRTVAGLRPELFAVTVGGVAVVAALGFIFARRWKDRKESLPAGAETEFEDLRGRFNEARSLRLRGDGVGFALVMLELLRRLGEPANEAAAELAVLEEELRFGGQVPRASELDRLQREVSRLLEGQRPDRDAAARERLRLQDNEENA